MAVQRSNVLLGRARTRMGWTQKELAEKVGAGHRTVARWESGRSDFAGHFVERLARVVHPVDRDLAAEILTLVGQTLVTAKLEAPPPPPPPPEPPPTPPSPAPVVAPSRPTPSVASLRAGVDAIVCVAAEAADTSPRAVRGAVLLVLRHAREVGLDLEAASQAGVLGEAGSPVVTLAGEG